MTAAPASEPFLFSPGGSAGSAIGTDSRYSAGIGDSRYADDSSQFGDAAGAGQSSFSAESLVDQARQEISQIVREVAAAQRSEGGRERYVRFLADRILRAMAAHGVVVWRADPTDSDWRYEVEHRLGTVTDHQLDETEKAVHECLLLEVAGQGSPVVVPPTPGASDREVPANPTSHPAALVPVHVDPTSAFPTCLIEVFLEPGGSPASQRGSLRFLAQMGDLAGEFLRAEHLRSLTRRLSEMDQCVRVVDSMQSLSSTIAIEAAWVDAASRLTGSPRVALCRVDRGRPRIVAVSHVDRIDQHGDAAAAIRKAANAPMHLRGNVALASMEASSTSEAVPERDRQTNDRRTNDRRKSSHDHLPVLPRWVVSLKGDDRWRMVMLQRGGDLSQPEELDGEALAIVERLLIGARQAWSAAQRVESIPGGKWWIRLTLGASGAPDRAELASLNPTQNSVSDVSSPRPSDWVFTRESAVSPLRRRVVLVFAMALVAGMFLWVPIPSTIPVTGVIRPIELDTYHARHDSTVQTIHVRHGQSVEKGDLLATLKSDDLGQRQTALLGRRAVLLQKREQANRDLVSSSDAGQSFAGVPSGDEMNEEIASIDEQLKIILQSQEDLVLRARRDGRVDAWRINERLSNRPLRRGDAVVSVIAAETTWVADATIPQRRVHRISEAIKDNRLVADVAPRWTAHSPEPAIAHRFGPVTTDPVDGTPGVILRLTLSKAPELGEQPLVETPARISLRCGRTSIGSFLFEDIWGWLKTRAGMYL